MFIDNNKRVCQYCEKYLTATNIKKTSEHIFSNGLIKLFPEQYIAFNGSKKFIDNKGIIISDVCKECNRQTLSSLDNYGVKLIRNNF
ncbi:hypothetical protein EZN00_00611 [Clostridium tyrobutyricum]|jgi:hypothetical protein|nr:hypothetical protein [Clostridium tyrobutyricum]QCH27022.1 hypothetical protein EZN00_00611 [Clostridium tyrobutyricum]